jgi:M6 family metalloprotease-like protein
MIRFRAGLCLLGVMLAPAGLLAQRGVFVRHDATGRERLEAVAVPAAAAPLVMTGPAMVASPVTGTERYVVIGCRYSDVAGEPITPATMAQLIGNTYPGLGDYFREISNGNYSLTGSTAVGWFGLPQGLTYYNPLGQADPVRMYTECMGAADASVYFPDYAGVVMVFNGDILGTGYYKGFSSQSTIPVTIDGTTKGYRLVFISAAAAGNQFVWAHSIGHTLDLRHTSGPPPYTPIPAPSSFWDMMAKGGFTDGAYPPRIAVHLAGLHKYLLGWLPASRIYHAATGTDVIIPLERSALPPANTNYLLAIVPIPGAGGKYYTVEARKVAGYDRLGDSALAGEGVLVHRVQPESVDPIAEVIDQDGNGNPNDAGGYLLPGESFLDEVNRILISVASAGTTGYSVRVCNAASGSGIYGDVNGDGVVNVIDAQLVARYSVGLSVPDASRTQVNGDVNADGAANVIDAQLISRHSVGLSAPGSRIGQTVTGGC